MKILMMSDTLPNPDSGAAGTDMQMAAALRSLGHDVDEVWADSLQRRIKHGNAHYLLELPREFARETLKRVGQINYDVVQISQPHGYLAAKRIRALADRPLFVHRSHGLEGRVALQTRKWDRYAPPTTLVRRGLREAMRIALHRNERWIAQLADGHIVSAQLCADYLCQTYDLPPVRIAVVPQAPPATYQQQPAAPMSSDRSKSILHVGQYAFFKAPMIVAQVFSRLAEARPDILLTWVCATRDHGAAAASLTPEARHRTRFVDWIPQSELMSLYDSHGLFIFPSFFEGFGKVFLEAMARGMVVVASDEGGARDVIQSGTDGFVVDVGDAVSMADCCLGILSDADQLGRISSAAVTTAKRYTWARVAAEAANFYARLRALG